MTNEEFIHGHLVATGALAIRGDGTIWRIFRISNKGDRHLDPITPQRAEVNAPHGYSRLVTKIYGRRVSIFTHRLVYYHFHGEIPCGLVINHRDGDKRNNHPNNLEAVTQDYNNAHSWHTLRRSGYPPLHHFQGLSHPHARFTREQVLDIRSQLRSGKGVKAIATEMSLPTVLPISRINLGISYRDVVEEETLIFPLNPSKFRKSRLVAPPLPGTRKSPR